MSTVAGQVVINYRDNSKRVINVSEQFFNFEDEGKKAQVSLTKKATDLSLLGGEAYKVTVMRGDREVFSHVFPQNKPYTEEKTRQPIDERLIKRQLRREWKNVPWMGKAIISMGMIKSLVN